MLGLLFVAGGYEWEGVREQAEQLDQIIGQPNTQQLTIYIKKETKR